MIVSKGRVRIDRSSVSDKKRGKTAVQNQCQTQLTATQTSIPLRSFVVNTPSTNKITAGMISDP
jgi:hypothetical protein